MLELIPMDNDLQLFGLFLPNLVDFTLCLHILDLMSFPLVAEAFVFEGKEEGLCRFSVILNTGAIGFDQCTMH
jgi:hypothetical protein